MQMRNGLLLAAVAGTLIGLSGACGDFALVTDDGGATGDDQGTGGPDAGHDAVRIDGMVPDAGSILVDGGHLDATSGSSSGSGDDGGGSSSGSNSGTGSGGNGDASNAPDGPAPEAGCPTGQLSCGGACVPDDVSHCGTCGHSCTSLPHVAGTTTCTAGGACSFPASACASGWADCNGKPDDGCEQDITQASHCGSCSTVCSGNMPVCGNTGSGIGCVSGCSQPTPNLCSGTCTNLTSDPKNCHACSNACGGVTNGQPACNGGTCVFTCNQSFTGCPTSAPSACVDEQNDPANCGSCTNQCSGPTNGNGSAACKTGACTLNCAAGYSACPATGVPTQCDNLSTDLNNCGSCGTVCTTTVQNAHPTCGGQCGFACNSGAYCASQNACIPTPTGYFVSPAGGGDCSAGAPCSLAQALAKGSGTVYLDQGSYGAVQFSSGTVAIVGGWKNLGGGNWTTCDVGTTAAQIVAPAAGGAGASAYGVFATGGSLSITNVAISVGKGGDGSPASGTGAQGSAPPAAGSCGAASNGATGSVGPAGAAGVRGSYSASGYSPGNGGQSTLTGGTGATGTAGGDPNTHASCQLDTSQTGAGCTNVTASSSQGLPGCGSGGGHGGPGGGGGGASIGIFAGGAAVVSVSGVSVQTGGGGSGQPGGAGGPGGSRDGTTTASGSLGATGSSGSYQFGCVNTPNGCKPDFNCGCTTGSTGSIAGGSAGGAGGAGGQGGQGGGGSGGDSLCYATSGGGSVSGALASCLAGPGGAGAGAGATGTSGTNN